VKSIVVLVALASLVAAQSASAQAAPDTDPATSVGPEWAQLNGTLAGPTSAYRFEYQAQVPSICLPGHPTPCPPWQVTPWRSSSLAGDISAVITHLRPNTEYVFHLNVNGTIYGPDGALPPRGVPRDRFLTPAKTGCWQHPNDPGGLPECYD
jgi:hypothetical protein